MTNPAFIAREPVAVRLRKMTKADLSAVVDIEEQVFEPPWSPKDFINMMKNYNCFGVVATNSNGIVGYLLYEPFPRGLVIVNIAVHPWLVRQSIGTQLVRWLKETTQEQGLDRIGITVRETRLETQLFLRAMEFRCVNVMHDHYPGYDDDAYVFRWDLNPTPPL